MPDENKNLAYFQDVSRHVVAIDDRLLQLARNEQEAFPARPDVALFRERGALISRRMELVAEFSAVGIRLPSPLDSRPIQMDAPRAAG